MDVLKVLRVLEEIETGLEQLYARLADRFDEDPGAFALFANLSRDERSHKNQIGFQIRLVFRERKSFDEVDVDYKGIVKTNEEIKELLESEEGPENLEQAVIAAIRFESSAAELYYNKVIIQSNPQIAGLIKTLAKENTRHYESLVNFALEREIVTKNDIPGTP